jgi:Ca-activated chloride channel family protein
MYSFERPGLAIPCLAVLIIIVILPRFRRDAVSPRLSLGPPGGSRFSPPIRAELSVAILRVADFVGATLVALAALGPISVITETVWLDRGADVLFIIDASPSMSARDMDGRSRFESAKSLIADFASSRGADAIGLVALGRDAALLVPPTTDHAVLLDRLENLAIAEFGDGTALGLGLSIAAFHLNGSTARRKAAVLLTDGENNAGELHPLTGAAALYTVGASLWVIGIGTNGDVPIDYVDPETGLHRSGMLDSRFDPEGLRSLARAAAGGGGGYYFSATSPALFSKAFSLMAENEAVPVVSRVKTRTESAYPYFIIPGVLLLLVSRLVRRIILGALL